MLVHLGPVLMTVYALLVVTIAVADPAFFLSVPDAIGRVVLPAVADQDRRRAG
eukprot:SAG11_NODE_14692_length_603_cov_0.720238_2_plen_52_part_01